MRRTGLAFLEQERSHSGAHLVQRHPSASWLREPLPHLCADLCSESVLAESRVRPYPHGKFGLGGVTVVPQGKLL